MILRNIPFNLKQAPVNKGWSYYGHAKQLTKDTDSVGIILEMDGTKYMPHGLGIIINSDAKQEKVIKLIHFIGYFEHGVRNGYGQYSTVCRPMIDIKTGIFTGINLFEGNILRPLLSQNITACNDHNEFVEINGSIQGQVGQLSLRF